MRPRTPVKYQICSNFSFPPAYAEIKPCYDLSSDHTPIILALSTTIMSQQDTPRLHSKHTDWAVYETAISEKLSDKLKLKTKEDIEVAITAFTGILQHAAQIATPAQKRLAVSHNLPSEVKRLLAAKRRARIKWHKTHAPDDRRLFNNASNRLKTAIHKLSNERFTTYIATLKHNDQSVWKPIKSRKRPRLHLPPIHKNGTPPGPWAKSDVEKVELFARHLAEVFSPHDKTLDQELENKLAANSTDSEKLSAFTTDDIIRVLHKLHPLKAPGHDRITALMIQKRPPKEIQTLMHI